MLLLPSFIIPTQVSAHLKSLLLSCFNVFCSKLKCNLWSIFINQSYKASNSIPWTFKIYLFKSPVPQIPTSAIHEIRQLYKTSSLFHPSSFPLRFSTYFILKTCTLSYQFLTTKALWPPFPPLSSLHFLLVTLFHPVMFTCPPPLVFGQSSLWMSYLRTSPGFVCPLFLHCVS